MKKLKVVKRRRGKQMQMHQIGNYVAGLIKKGLDSRPGSGSGVTILRGNDKGG